MNDRERILQVLRRVGSRGLTRVDFAAPDVIDGGRPIMNIPARIKDLRDAGYLIGQLPERRNRCVVYVLRQNQPAPHEPIAEPEPEPEAPLFAPGPRVAIFDFDPDDGDDVAA